MNLRRLLLWLLAGTLFLPLAILLILVIGRLLVVLGDPAGAAAVRGVGLAIGIVWVLAVIGLPITLAIDAVLAKDRSTEKEEES